MKKELENIFKKIKHEDKDFLSQKRGWENLEQIIKQFVFTKLVESLCK